MNLPFGLPVVKETNVRRKDNSSDVVIQYERKLAEYREVLEHYRRYITEYSSKLEGYDRRIKENQLDNVQTVLDMTYLKEQGDKTIELLYQLKAASSNKSIVGLESITEAIDNTNRKLDTIDNHFNTEQESINNLGKNLLTMAINIDNMDKRMDTIIGQLESLDKNVVNRMSEFHLELQKQTIYQNRQLQTELIADIDKVNQTVKKDRTLLWFILIFNFFGLCSIAFLVLYYLEIIPFSF